MMSWRVARCLLTLREQIDAAHPNRNRASDGAIGDARHRTQDSDHNPWYQGHIVTAMDITHDPAHGVDIDQLTDELAASRDPRIKYLIANSWILDTRPQFNPWQWMPYYGSNPHTSHMHISVVASPLCDDTSLWQLPSLTGQPEEFDMDRDTFEQQVHNGVLQALRNPAVRAEIIKGVWYEATVARGDAEVPTLQELADAKTRAIAADAGIDGLTAAVAELSDDPSLTAERVEQIVRDAVEQNMPDSWELTGTSEEQQA